MNNFKKIFESIDSYNRYIKLPDFKNRVKQHNKNKSLFYSLKNYFINVILRYYPEFLKEWHYEFRDDEPVYLVVFLIDGEEFRFHQLEGSIHVELSDTLRTDNEKYYHDEYPDNKTFDFDDNKMLKEFDFLNESYINMFEDGYKSIIN